MKHPLKIVLIILLCLYFSGCQYILPAWVQGGKVKINKIEEKDIPAETIKGDVFKVYMEPANPTPPIYNRTPWYTPEGMKGDN